MKKTLLTLIIICIYFKGNSQTISNYSGAFESKNLDGKVTYVYYTENNVRIFNGPFNFASNDQSFKIIGNFNNDLKNGEWKTILKNFTYKDLVVDILINAEINGNYSDGKKSGFWSVQKTKTITPSKNGITQYYQASADIFSYLLTGETQKKSETVKIIENVETNFKENHFSGEYKHNINDRIIITGKFDSNGLCNDNWKINYYKNNIKHNIEIIFKNGVIYKITDFNQSTGENLTTYQNEFDLEKFFAHYNLAKNSSIINDKVYSLKPIGYIQPSFKIDILKELLNNWNETSFDNGYYQKEIDKGMIKEILNPINEIFLNEEQTTVLKNQKDNELEKLKQKEYLKREKERKEQLIIEKDLENFNLSNAGQIQNEIQKHFDNWAKKGEFETKEQHSQRFTSSANQEFDKITNEIITQNKDKFLNKSYQVNLGKYDSEKQSFNLTENINGKTILVPISIKISGQLKEKILTVSSNFNSHIYFIPIDAALENNNWVISKAIVIFDFITQQLQGEPKKFFNIEKDREYYFKYEVQKRNGKLYPISKTGYVQEGSMTKIYLVDIKNIDELNKKDKFIYTDWESNEIENKPIKFTYEIVNDKTIIRINN